MIYSVLRNHFANLCCDIWSNIWSHLVCLSSDWVIVFLQVAARSENGVRRRTQAMSRSCSKRKSRFSSLWGLDTTSKKKTKAHPSINQVGDTEQLFFSFNAVYRTAMATKRFPFASSSSFYPSHSCLNNDHVTCCFWPSRSLLMAESKWKTPLMACLIIQPRKIQ